MNFKERGITVGDILILLIITITATTVVKSFNNDKQSTFNQINQGKTLYEDIVL